MTATKIDEIGVLGYYFEMGRPAREAPGGFVYHVLSRGVGPKVFIRVFGLSHVRASPYFPHSNGKLERFHGILKQECICPSCPATVEEAERRVREFVEHYNNLRLNSAIGYISPADKLASSDAVILASKTVFTSFKRSRSVRRASCPLIIMKVSNGRDIVLTDELGHYEIGVSDDTIIFLIKPRGWATPLNAHNLPQFYYIHKPAGSPQQKFPGVQPTGPLPSSIDFPLTPQEEPDQFRALMFGDTQPRDVQEVEYMTHDIIEQVVAANAHDASLGVTLGDIVFDDLDVFEPHNQSIALIGLPWYNVIGNHDMNFDSPDDKHTDETFESYYGPSYYSFDHGPVHFLVLDDVVWHGATESQRGHVRSPKCNE